MVFKKFDEQQVYQVPCKASAEEIDAKVGDVISYVPSTQIAAKVTKLSEAETALAAGSELYLIAQSDSVTYKTGVAYKSYAVVEGVKIGTSDTTIVAAYKIDKITNVEGWEAE